MSNGRRVAWNTIVQFVGKILTLILGLLILKVISTTLGPAQTGQYTTALTLAQLFTTVGDLGLYAYAVRNTSRADNNASGLVKQIFTLRSITGAVLFILMLALLQILPYTPDFRTIAAIALLSGFFSLLSATTVAFFQAKLRMEYAVIGDILQRTLAFLGILYAVSVSASLTTIMWILVGSMLLNLLINTVFLKQILKLPVGWSTTDWKPILKESAPIWITAMLGLVYFKIDSVMLSLLPLPAGKENFIEVGYYGAVYKYLEILIIFPSIFLGSLFPIMSQNATNLPKLKSYLQKTSDVLFVLSAPLLVGTYLFAGPIIVFVSSTEFLPGTPALKILSLAFLFSSLGSMFSYVVMSINKQSQLILPYLIATVFNITANYFAIRNYSFMGAATVTLATEAIVAGLAFWVSYRAIQFVPQTGILVRAIIAAGAMALALLPFQAYPLYLVVPLGAVVYGIVLFLVGGIDKSLIQLLRPNRESSL